MEMISSGAEISECGLFRTRLWRAWAAAPRVLWVMLNPSEADANKNDPTIETIIEFSHRWGFGGIEVANLYDFRTPSPKALRDAGYRQSAGNVAMLRALATTVTNDAGIVMAAYGTHAQPNRALNFRVDMQILGIRLYHLGLNNGGSPKHPLYIRRDTPRALFQAPL